MCDPLITGIYFQKHSEMTTLLQTCLWSVWQCVLVLDWFPLCFIWKKKWLRIFNQNSYFSIALSTTVLEPISFFSGGPLPLELCSVKSTNYSFFMFRQLNTFSTFIRIPKRLKHWPDVYACNLFDAWSNHECCSENSSGFWKCTGYLKKKDFEYHCKHIHKNNAHTKAYLYSDS